MITYHYRCENCEHEFEIGQSIKDKPLKKCSECKKLKLERVIYGGCHVSVSPGVTTVGKLAEHNSKLMGKTKLQELAALEKEESKKNKLSPQIQEAIEKSGGKVKEPAKAEKSAVWWGKENREDKIKKINKMTDEQKIRYIKDGD